MTRTSLCITQVSNWTYRWHSWLGGGLQSQYPTPTGL